ncbi:MAG TPA: hypothetical protein VH414_04470 [Lichenihabitans sp.]|jgi:ribose/xylose/arabinose/galactoside ABC-type transport system permease subunit|nr:hypothetical protein [Lichenihabitans sp.]
MKVAASPIEVEGRPLRGIVATVLARHPMVVTALLLFVLFAAVSPPFGTLGNVANIARQTASVLVLGLGMMLVVLVGGIDLSVGSVVLLAATVAGGLLVDGVDPLLAIAGALGAGALVGLLNAALVEGLRISPVIVTLGTMIGVRGIGLAVLARFQSWIDIDAPVFNDLAGGRLGPLPLDALVAGGVALACFVVLGRMAAGRRLYAVGDGAAAARLSGVRVRLVRVAAYVACGALAGLAGVLVAARTGVISPSVGLGLEFYAVAIVALGAGGLPSGQVKVGQTAAGAITLMMVFNVMTIHGVPGTWQTTVTGALLFAAMVAGRLLQGGAPGEAGIAEALQDVIGSRLWAAVARHTLIGATVMLGLAFAIVNPAFATWANVVALVEQNAALAIVAVGAMLGIVSRTVDLSPGSVVALGAVAVALAFGAGWGVLPSLVAGVLACLMVYGLNGVVVGRLGLDPLIVTLAAWIWARGLAVSLTGASTLPVSPAFVSLMTRPVILGFTPCAALAALAFACGWLILSRTRLGLRLYALGGDARMLRQAGVDVGRTRLLVLLTMGAFTAAGMLVMLGRLGAAAPTAGFGLELDAIVAVVIGGASFRGGSGRLGDTACGVLFLAVLNDGLSGLQMSDAGFDMVKGAAILGALALRAGVTLLPGRRS